MTMPSDPQVKRLTMPIQAATANRKPAVVPTPVYMRAYEVYSGVHGPQEAMITNGCRGGFGVGELVAFLYAASFPKDQWRVRVNEALNGINLESR